MRFDPFLIGLALTVASVGTVASDWTISDAATEGVSPDELVSVTRKIAAGEYGSIDSLVIARNGKLIYHENFGGYQNQLRPVFSVTKSVGATLVGILNQDGAVEPDSPVLDFFPQYPLLLDLEAKRGITVEHLLQQRHGLDWDEWSTDYESTENPVNATHSGNDWFLNILNWPMGAAPGSRFAYSSGASTLMSGLIWNRTGMTTQQFAQERLFDPLGITQFHWEIIGRSRLMGQGSTQFPNGIAPLGFSLWLNTLDMASIGQLYLQNGLWQGEQLLSEAWVERSTRAYSNGVSDSEVFGDGGAGHGYQWWTGYLEDADGRSFDTFYASGWGRQYIFVIPEAQLVVATLAADFDYSGPGIGTALRQHILGGISTDPRQWLALDDAFTGSWYDTDMPGQGFNVDVLEDRNEVLIYWFTYDQSGDGQRWLFAQGPIEDNVAKLMIKTTEGGTFARPSHAAVSTWGDGEIMFDSCTSGRFRFRSESEDVSADLPLTRLTGGFRCDPTSISSSNKILLP